MKKSFTVLQLNKVAGKYRPLVMYKELKEGKTVSLFSTKEKAIAYATALAEKDGGQYLIDESIMFVNSTEEQVPSTPIRVAKVDAIA